MTLSGRTDYLDASTEWACARKKIYADEKTARRVAARMTASNADLETARAGFWGVVIVAYACTRCGSFHVGRAPA